jgi:FkbM family methyltransferase
MPRLHYVAADDHELSAWFTYREGTNDQHVIIASFVYDEYNLKRLEPGDVMIDIGAHIGAVAVRVATQGARVYAFEPIVENFCLLQQNVAQNGLDGLVTCYQEAVMGNDGETTICLGSLDDPWYHWIGGAYADTPHVRTVPAVSLGTIFERDGIERCAAIKMDAEGAEYEILKNASVETLGRIKRIVGEHHGTGDSPDDPRATLLYWAGPEFEDVTPPASPAGFDFVRGQA